MINSKSKFKKQIQTCFISAPAGIRLGNMLKILSEKGLRPWLCWEALFPPFEDITELIAACDLFIAIIDNVHSNENVYFELGYAVALKKRILIIVAPEIKNLPNDIMKLFYIRAHADDTEAIYFAIEQLLAAPKIKKKKRRKKLDEVKTRPIGTKADELIRNFELLGDNISEREMEMFVTSALSESGINTMASSCIPDKGIDLSIWVNELEPLISNPILIEFKKYLNNRHQVEYLYNQILNYSQEFGMRLAIIFYKEAPEDILRSFNYSFPNMIFLKVPEFLKELRHKSIGNFIRELRNKIIHKEYPNGKNF